MKENKTTINELVPGDWISTEYGFSHVVFYVVSVHPDKNIVRLGNPDWLSNAIIALRNIDFLYLGNTKRRRWIKFLPSFIQDMFCPYKSL